MLRMATTEEAITTGVKEIAKALGGGIREGSLVFIEGESRAGKSVLSQHLAHGTLCAKKNAVAYYTIDRGAEDLIIQMDSMALDAKHDFVTDRFRIYTVGSNAVFKDPQKSLQLLIKHISTLPERFNLVVVDSVTPLMIDTNTVDKIDFFRECKELCEQNRSIVLVAHTHLFEGRTFSRAYAMSDYYLKLRSKDVVLGRGQIDNRVIKILEVTKLCGAERHAPGGIKFEIKPKVGIQILPFITVKA